MVNEPPSLWSKHYENSNSEIYPKYIAACAHLRSGNGRVDVFDISEKQMTGLPLFDIAEARRHADIGIAVASENRAGILLYAKQVAREIALSRVSRECDADDVAARLTASQRKELANAAGGIFKGREWKFVRYVTCKRINAHARDIRVWRYVGG